MHAALCDRLALPSVVCDTLAVVHAPPAKTNMVLGC
jgi:hypothetical protein